MEELEFNSVNTGNLPSDDDDVFIDPITNKDDPRTLEVVTCTGTIFHISINPKWKVTFGRLQEGMQHYTGNQAKENGNGLALRIYESKERQLACFRDVESFRDIAIPMDVVYAPPKPPRKGEQADPKDVIRDKNVGSLVF
jgi:hypothetical protein